MIVAVPFATAVTSPAVDTVATDELDVVHVTVAPDIAVPPPSFTVALTVTVSPSDAKVFVLGDSSTVDVTCATVTADVAVAEPEVAVIVAVPSATEVTSPVDETVATLGVVEAHVTGESGMTVPPASLTVAVNVAVSAIDTKAIEVGDNSMVPAS